MVFRIFKSGRGIRTNEWTQSSAMEVIFLSLEDSVGVKTIVKGPLKYLLMPLLGENQFAIILHMCASTGPNLDNSHRELKWISSWRHRTTPKVTWPETENCILTKWLNPLIRIFCTMTIQKPFSIILSMRFGLWWKMKKWEGKMCFFDHSFANMFFVFHFFAKPMLGFLENVTFFRIVFKSSNYNHHSRRKVLFSLHRKWWANFQRPGA